MAAIDINQNAIDINQDSIDINQDAKAPVAADLLLALTDDLLIDGTTVGDTDGSAFADDDTMSSTAEDNLWPWLARPKDTSDMHEDLLSIYEGHKIFGPFKQDIRPGLAPDASKEDSLRHLLQGKTIFGPFEHHPNVIQVLTREERLRSLYDTYVSLFPKCPRLYLKEQSEATVDNEQARSRFLASFDGVPPMRWLQTLSGEYQDDGNANAWVRQMKLHRILTSTYPTVSPGFWMEQIKKNSEVELYNLVLSTFWTPSLLKEWPTRESYETGKRDAEMIQEYLADFKPDEFREMDLDPLEHYQNDQRQESQHYKDGVLTLLKREFSDVGLPVLKLVLKNSNGLFYVAFKAMEDFVGKRRKTIRPDGPMPNNIDIGLLREVQFTKNVDKFVEHKRVEALTRQDKLVEAEALGLMKSCPICFDDECLPEEMTACPNFHIMCLAVTYKCTSQDIPPQKSYFLFLQCLKQAANVAIGEEQDGVKCSNDNCGQHIPLSAIEKVVDQRTFVVWSKKIQLQEAQAAIKKGLVTCPFCSFGVVMMQSPEENSILICKNLECGKETCRLCNELNHIPLTCEEIESTPQLKLRTQIELKMTMEVLRHCNKCKKAFFKTEGCNKMDCTCGNTQCYLCGENVILYRHFYNDANNRGEAKCPLHSDNAKLLADDIMRGAKLGKEEVLKQNPGVKLFSDPTKGVLNVVKMK